MENGELLKQISELTAQISGLPKGYISRKTISGKAYYYHQWSENGVKQSRYLHDGEIEALAQQIEQRKSLQAKLRALKAKPSAGRKKRNEENSLQCTLMHKRIKVADLELDDAAGFIQKIGTMYAPEHLPVGVSVHGGVTDRAALNKWWTDRSIPASRPGVREALEALDIQSTKMLLVKCYGLSLSDQYWICPKGSGLTWDSINFFENDFSEDIGDVLFGADKKADGLDLSSPDNTLDGNLKKRWKIINGKRRLVKGGSNPFRQQPFNEIIAAEIMERLGIPHVLYTVTWNKGAPYSVCEDFVTKDTELVSAWRIFQTQKRNNSASVYRHFVDCCGALGIQDAVPFLDRMIVLDYIIANEDRHMGNFGVIRNAETLEWLGFAPIYDSGSSLGYDKLPAQIRNEEKVVCKPFEKSYRKQLELVTDFSWIDFDRLSDVRNLIAETLSAGDAGEYMDDNRIRAIADAVERRIGHIRKAAETQYEERKKVVKTVCVFPLVTEGDETLKYVFPTKQRAAQTAINLAKADGRIDRLVIFGSAVTMQCGMKSDMDIAVDAPNMGEDDFMKLARGFYRGIDSEVDVVHYNNIHNALLKREIDEKGVPVYVKR